VEVVGRKRDGEWIVLQNAESAEGMVQGRVAIGLRVRYGEGKAGREESGAGVQGRR